MKTGKISENIIKRSILKTIDVKSAARATDCALFTGYVANESKPECGAHALIRAVNRCVQNGYEPTEVSMSITMPVSMREKRLKEILQTLRKAVKEHGLNINGGHTESVEGLACPIVTVTVAGKRVYGICEKTTIKPGTAIVMTKWMALSGTVWIASENGKLPTERYPSFILENALDLEQFICIRNEANIAHEHGDTYMYACGDGGVFAALWKLADRVDMGLEIDLKSIPVRQETIELSEVYDINPYKLRSDGALLIATADPDGLVERLHKEEIPATQIGHFCEGKDRVILSGDERRFLEEPTQDEQVGVLCYNGKSGHKQSDTED
jgi:hydrogenase maturation factor